MNSIGTELSRQLGDAVERAGTSIVRVEGRPHLASSGIVWAEGIVVTASHTVHHEDDTLVGRDEVTDVAVLRVPGATTPIVWSDAAPRVGEIVIVAGRPGRSVRATVGFITSVDPRLDVDAHLPPGFSGGPLLAADGRAIGMNTSHLARGGTTIPHATLTRIVSELLERGSVRRPHLGVGVFPVASGLVVLSVQDDSAASKAGVIVGDVLLTDRRALRDALDVDQPFTLKLSRGGEPRELEVRA